jgi:PPOX class probable F420-dependent enzyme
MAQLTDPQVAALLDPANYATITTVNEDGSLTSSIVWFSVDDGKLALNSAEGRRWPTNLDRDGRVVALISAGDNPWEFVEIRGNAVRKGDEAEADDHIDALAKRYIGQDKYPFRQEGEKRVKYVVDAGTVRHQKQG